MRKFIKIFFPVVFLIIIAMLSYPDKSHAVKSASPGGDIAIHGISGGFSKLGRLHVLIHHTRCCIALNNREIDELAAITGKGTTIEIRP